MTPLDDYTGQYRAKVLIVDDTPVNQLVLREALSEDYEVLIANDGPSAVRIARGETRPDLILLDVNMPGMDGYTVCKQLKESPYTCDIPVIFITACNSPGDEVRGFMAGASDYITRPLQLPVVQARVRAHLYYCELIQRLEFRNRGLAKRLAEFAETDNVPLVLYAHALEHTHDAVTGQTHLPTL
ncbi:response regulator [Plasticicumulans sp.]|uniref:response regulator n=1 Tax=Plasticicumulans sp. TaxID=2307179 RepID=UPI0039383CE5